MQVEKRWRSALQQVNPAAWTTADFSSSSSSFLSPAQQARAVLVDERLVVGLEGLDIRHIVALGVQVKLVELLDPGAHLLVALAGEVEVVVARVPRVEGVVADHVEALHGQGAVVVLEDAVHVLVVAPGHEQAVQAAVGLVDAKVRVVLRVLLVGAELKLLAEDDRLAGLAADGVRVAHCRPLRLTPQRKDLADVVDEPGEVEPVLVRVQLADALGCLESVARVGHVHVRVAVVDQLVELKERVHHRHLLRVELGPLGNPSADALDGLADVHQLVGLAHNLKARVGGVQVRAEELLGLLIGRKVGGNDSLLCVSLADAANHGLVQLLIGSGGLLDRLGTGHAGERLDQRRIVLGLQLDEAALVGNSGGGHGGDGCE
eukprot:m.57254 g.57254  ORF g.57254 m.57254 type:complete len:376 (-) comp13445_c0_seq3:345-1472(-)